MTDWESRNTANRHVCNGLIETLFVLINREMHSTNISIKLYVMYKVKWLVQYRTNRI